MDSPTQFLVLTSGQQTKKIGIQNGLNNDLVKDLVKQKFNLKENSYLIKYWDGDVEEYIDIEPDSFIELNTMRVVKMKIINMEIEEKRDGKQDEQKEQETMQRTPLKKTCGGHVPEPHMATPGGSQSTPLRSVGAENSNSRTVLTPISTSPADFKRKNWPKIYQLPLECIPRDVILKLEAGQPLDRTGRRKLLDGIYADVSKYSGGLYPTSDMYDSIVDSLFTTFPLLRNSEDLNVHSVRALWKDRILYKFSNSRRRIDNAEPEVLLKKKKTQSGEKEKENTTGQLTWGLQNFCPDIPSSEDETSVAKHIEWLQREYQKAGADHEMQNVDMRMNLTFASRRQMIVKEGVPIQDVVEKFPWIKEKRQLLLEFERLKPNTDTTDLEQLIGNALMKYRSAVARLVSGKQTPEIMKRVQSSIPLIRTESQKNYAEDCLSLLGLSYLFKEKLEKIVRNVPNSESVNLIVKKEILTVEEGAFELLIEGNAILECASFFDLYISFIAAIYVFNLVYPKPLEKSLVFVQNVFLNLKDSDRIEKRLLSVLAAIHGEMKKKQ